MSPLIVVAALGAGALGALARWGVTVALAGRPARIPAAVFVVNVIGSALGGVLLALVDVAVVPDTVRYIVVGGFCGGLTTFSTFTVETIQLMLEGQRRQAVRSVAANLVIGVGMCTAAWFLTHAVAG
jgi:fluoride exporter